RPMLERAIAIEFGQEPEQELAEVLGEPTALEGLLTMQAFDEGPAAATSWRAESGLLMYSDTLAGTFEDAAIISRLDIMNNARRSLDEAGSLASISHGVWETLTERDILGDMEHNTAN